MSSLITAITDVVRSLFEVVGAVFTTVLDVVEGALSAVLNFVTGIVNMALELISGTLHAAGGVGKFLIGNAAVILILAVGFVAYTQVQARQGKRKVT